MRRLVLAALIVAALAAPSQAQVHVNVGIALPGPPTLAVIPGAPVYYAPGAPVNVFFYALIRHQGQRGHQRLLVPRPLVPDPVDKQRRGAVDTAPGPKDLDLAFGQINSRRTV